MARFIVPAGLLIAGLIHLLPLAGVLGAARLNALYGLDIDDHNLALLMAHRAVLFGMLGAFMVTAVWVPAWRTPALVAGLISVLAFLLLAWREGPLNPGLMRVVWADVVALAALLPAVVAHHAQRG